MDRLNRTVKTHKESLEENNNMLVEMQAEFAQAFQNCISFSCQGIPCFFCDLVENGRASNLMKGSLKRKGTKVELEEVKHEEKALCGDIQGYLMDVKSLKQEHVELLAF